MKFIIVNKSFVLKSKIFACKLNVLFAVVFFLFEVGFLACKVPFLHLKFFFAFEICVFASISSRRLHFDTLCQKARPTAARSNIGPYWPGSVGVTGFESRGGGLGVAACHTHRY